MKQPGCFCRPCDCGISCPVEDCCRPCPPRPCPPEQCHCDLCRRKECGCGGGGGGRGYLLPRVIASGREWLRRCQACLTVEGLPDCAEPPLTLVAVCAAGEPTWTEEVDPCQRALCLQITIPLMCQVRDCRGCVYSGRACVQVGTTMRLSVPHAECWRNTMMVLPCVRLVCVPCASNTPCFDALLEILVECYMVRWEAYLPQNQRPVCPPPDLPLYPQPHPRME